MPVIKTLKNGVWTKVSSFGELATATSSLNGLMSSADKVKLDEMDYIVEQGTSGIWTYEKWNSGIVKLWATFSKTIGTSIASNSYISLDVPFPSNMLTSVINHTISCYVSESSTTYALNFSVTSRANTSKIYGYCWNNTGATKTVNIFECGLYVIGRWK